MIAVGCWICISCSSTPPSLVSLTWPLPSTSILSVPRGPRFVLTTSARPREAEQLMASAAAWRVRSAFGLIALIDDIVEEEGIIDQQTKGPVARSQSHALLSLDDRLLIHEERRVIEQILFRARTREGVSSSLDRERALPTRHA
jgi:hypothetical protein